MSLQELQVISHVVADIDNVADTAITANCCLSIETRPHITYSGIASLQPAICVCALHRNKQLTTLV